jgi:Immunoglobulin I-set domain
LPQIVPFSFGEDTTNAGDSASAACSVVKGDTPIVISWFFNGTEIRSNADITISNVGKKISMLSIESARAEYVGEYTCVAKNAAGATNISSYLYINGLIFDCHISGVAFLLEMHSPTVVLTGDFLFFQYFNFTFSFASNRSLLCWRGPDQCR